MGVPRKGRLRVRKLTDYTLGLYASREYIEEFGRPETADDLARHSLIGYVDDLVYTPELNYADDFLRGWQSDVEISTAIGQFEAVRAGVGIGVLHDFMAAGVADLVRLLPAARVVRSYWIVWHENMRVARRVTAAVDLLDQIVREERHQFILDG